MPIKLCVCLRLPLPLVVAALLGCAATAGADPKPLTKEEQAKVDQAIDKGVAFLKRIQRDKGDWPLYMTGGYMIGQTLLPAYALLESGVPANDPAIQKAAEFIRPRVLKLERTYEISLAVLFLDRLGDPKDKTLIQSLAVRLIAGQQYYTRGWNYRCPVLGKEQEEALVKALTELNRRQEAGESSRSNILKGLTIPRSLGSLTIFRDPRDLPWQEPVHSTTGRPDTALLVGTTDNSNTQFAILGLWAAQRHDVPVVPTFRLIVERFERSQQTNGGWGYTFSEERPNQVLNCPSMICVGLMGLASGRGLKLTTPGTPQPGAADLRLLNGFAALSRDIGIAAAGLEATSSQRGTYYLWSVERVAMLYDLEMIGGKDWYRWGAGILIASQRPRGEWKTVLVSGKDNGGLKSGAGPGIDTSFALLFLKRSHPMRELTPKLPLKGKELNQEISRLLTGADPLESSTTAPSKSEKPKR